MVAVKSLLMLTLAGVALAAPSDTTEAVTDVSTVSGTATETTTETTSGAVAESPSPTESATAECQSLAEIITTDPRFSGLAAALGPLAPYLVGRLNNTDLTEITIFAPSNEAFLALVGNGTTTTATELATATETLTETATETASDTETGSDTVTESGSAVRRQADGSATESVTESVTEEAATTEVTEVTEEATTATTTAAATSTAEAEAALLNTLDLISNHIAPGKILSTDLVNGTFIETFLLGGGHLVTIDDAGTIFIDNATIIDADIEACNGVIHIIDQVLPLPTGLSGLETPTATETAVPTETPTETPTEGESESPAESVAESGTEEPTATA